MFNLGLYKEGLRKTKVLAVLILAIMILFSIIQPIAHISEHARGIRQGWDWLEPTIRIYGLDASFMMLFAMFVGAPLITLSIFSFLNKRSSSDFYHAIPHKRETLYGSFIAAVLTWVVGGMWVTTAISVTIYATSSYTIIHLGSIILVLIGMSAACLLVISGISLAMAVTGTGLSNIITSGLILLLPRLLMSMFITMIVDVTRIVSYADFGLFGNFSRNIPIGIITHIFFFYRHYNESIHQIITRGTLYTFVLAVVYLILAGYLFKKRHSELATNPGTRFTQPIIRIAVTFIMTLPAIGMIVTNYLYGDDTFLGVLIFYLIALIGYFAYEFFTTKRIPKIVKMVPGLLIVVILNIGFIVGVRIGRSVILQEINVNNISSITIVNLNPDDWGRNSYVGLNARGMEIHDAQIAQFLGETLNYNINNIRDEGENDYWSWWEGTQIRIRFNIDGSRNLTRNVIVTDQSTLAELLIAYKPYRDLYLMIPEDFDSAHAWGERGDLTREETYRVLDVLREEIQEVDFASWYQLVGRMRIFIEDESSYLRNDEWITIYVQGMSNGYYYYSNFPITELTPRTLELYRSYARNRD